MGYGRRIWPDGMSVWHSSKKHNVYSRFICIGSDLVVICIYIIVCIHIYIYLHIYKHVFLFVFLLYVFAMEIHVRNMCMTVCIYMSFLLEVLSAMQDNRHVYLLENTHNTTKHSWELWLVNLSPLTLF